jgi:hypothetical protein
VPEWQLEKLAKKAELAGASSDVRLVVVLALEWLALGVNLGAGSDRAVISRLAFDDLELDGANPGAATRVQSGQSEQLEMLTIMPKKT